MLITGTGREFIIKDTHRGLWYEDGKLTKVLEAGRYKIPPRQRLFKRLPTVECLLVDVRQRELTIKGQEILTADKVATEILDLVLSGDCRDELLQSLHVISVVPAPNSSRLLVTVSADLPIEEFDPQKILELRERQTGRLRLRVKR